jgi:hypothetical protein
MLGPGVSVVAGIASLGGVIAVLVTGGGWWAFWPALLAVMLLTGPLRRRYWERVEATDRASVPLQVMWIVAGLMAIALFLALTQLFGVWFRQSTGNAIVGFLAALAAVVGWFQAREVRKRLLRTAGSEAGESAPPDEETA